MTFSRVIHRLLLMLLTLIGVTLLVFVLVSLSPGGVSAGLVAAGGESGAEAPAGGVGGPAAGSRRAAEIAYLEDRYGLDAPLPVQYLRWLARLSPLRFGPSDKIGSRGERVRAPRTPIGGIPAIDPPAQLSDSPTMHDARSPEAGPAAERRYDEASRDYAKARAALISARLAQESDTLESARKAEAAARAGLLAALAAAPFPSAGLEIIPGLLWIDRPDLGWSFKRGRPVSALIAEALPITLLLNGLSIALVYAAAVPAGVLCAARRGTWIDRVLSTCFSMLWSLPVVCASVLAVGFLASRRHLGLFPAGGLHSPGIGDAAFLPFAAGDGSIRPGWMLDWAWHLVLPVACQSYAGIAVISRLVRAAVLDNLGSLFVRTARAKGVSESDVVVYHAFRAGLLPLITVFSGVFPAMLSGSVIIERAFSIPGMGSLMIDAVNSNDRELLMACVLIAAAATVTGLLLADVLYALVDPRARRD